MSVTPYQMINSSRYQWVSEKGNILKIAKHNFSAKLCFVPICLFSILGLLASDKWVVPVNTNKNKWMNYVSEEEDQIKNLQQQQNVDTGSMVYIPPPLVLKCTNH